MDRRTSAILEQFAAGAVVGEIPPEVEYADELRALEGYLEAIRQFVLALAKGELHQTLEQRGPLAGSLKLLQANLLHITWQAARISEGDFSQRVDFIGDFSSAFNRMVDYLARTHNSLEAVNRRLIEEMAQLQQMTEALKQSEERFRLIASNVSDVIWTLDRSMSRFTYISPSIARLRGYGVEEAMEEMLDHAITAESLLLLRENLEQMVESYGRTGEIGCLSRVLEIEQICKGASIIPVEVVISAIIGSDGELREFVGIARDITQRRKVDEELRYLSTHDHLTQLYNRAFFDAELQRHASGREFPISLVLADLDGLKKVNDTLGHEAGDTLVKGAATVLRTAFRQSDVIARTGGDEFVVILEGIDEAGAATSLERINLCIEMFNAGNDGVPVSLSAGAATANQGSELQEALKEADRRMYQNKVERKQQRQ